MTDAEINREITELEGQGADPEGAGPASERHAALLAERAERAALRARPVPQQDTHWRSVLQLAAPGNDTSDL